MKLNLNQMTFMQLLGELYGTGVSVKFYVEQGTVFMGVDNGGTLLVTTKIEKNNI